MPLESPAPPQDTREALNRWNELAIELLTIDHLSPSAVADAALATAFELRRRVYGERAAVHDLISLGGTILEEIEARERAKRH